MNRHGVLSRRNTGSYGKEGEGELTGFTGGREDKAKIGKEVVESLVKTPHQTKEVGSFLADVQKWDRPPCPLPGDRTEARV